MKKILRGLRNDGEGWVYGFYWFELETQKHWIIYLDKEENAQRAIEVIPETVGQYTGLNDRNGVEIYEGDYVKCYDNDGVVTYIDGSFMLVKSENGKKILSILRPCWSSHEPVEVIGNIHENGKEKI